MRGGAWCRDKKGEVVSVQISRWRTKADMGWGGKIERATEKKDELLRLDKGQDCLSRLLMANANRPLLFLYLLCLLPVSHSTACVFFSIYLPSRSPFFPLLTPSTLHLLSSHLTMSLSFALQFPHIPSLNHSISPLHPPFIPSLSRS